MQIMRKRIKPMLVLIFISLFLCVLVLVKTRRDYVQNQLAIANQKKAQEEARAAAKEAAAKKQASDDQEAFVLNPIIDVSGWQLPSDLDYDTLSANISGAIVRVFGGPKLRLITTPLTPLELTSPLRLISLNFKNAMFQWQFTAMHLDEASLK